MDKITRKRRQECLQSKCWFAKQGRCKVYWGKDCVRQGGHKIPRIANKYSSSYFVDALS